MGRPFRSLEGYPAQFLPGFLPIPAGTPQEVIKRVPTQRRAGVEADEKINDSTSNSEAAR